MSINYSLDEEIEDYFNFTAFRKIQRAKASYFWHSMIDSMITESENKFWLYICGESGRGKTKLLELLRKKWVKEGCYYVAEKFSFMCCYSCSWQDLSAGSFESKQEAFDKLKECDLLFLDDLGSSSSELYKTERSIYAPILDEMNKKHCVITSNIEPGSLPDDNRILSRTLRQNVTLINFPKSEQDYNIALLSNSKPNYLF